MFKKRVSAFVLALGMTASMMVGAVAAVNNEQIQAWIRRDITVTYNGEAQSFKDANGAAVYPISYNGSTYLPVRGMADMMGVAIKWDNATKSVVVGKSDKKYVTQSMVGGHEQPWVIEKSQLVVDGKTYDSGIVNAVGYTGSYKGDGDFYIDTNGEYSNFHAIVYNPAPGEYDKDVRMTLITETGAVYETYNIPKGEAVEVNADISGVSVMRVCFNYSRKLTFVDMYLE